MCWDKYSLKNLARNHMFHLPLSLTCLHTLTFTCILTTYIYVLTCKYMLYVCRYAIVFIVYKIKTTQAFESCVTSCISCSPIIEIRCCPSILFYWRSHIALIIDIYIHTHSHTHLHLKLDWSIHLKIVHIMWEHSPRTLNAKLAWQTAIVGVFCISLFKTKYSLHLQVIFVNNVNPMLTSSI